jgi:2-polyprenyl-3-methyl-5-hydroxy-6-metoxy-1,4-benzoquinol methylase
MSVMNKTEYWLDYFTLLRNRKSESAQLGFSNERVMIQNASFILECAGEIEGKRVLDCGCGSGRLARIFHSLGGVVEAFDPLGDRISELQDQYPSIRWAESTLEQWTAAREQRDSAHTYDIVVASEVLQHIGTESLPALFALVVPGGRLIATVPNSDCPIVQTAAQRFDGHYTPLSFTALPEMLRALMPTAELAWRGFRFQDDQTLAPYVATGWNLTVNREESEMINRLLFVALKPSANSKS